jgi:hypothetical protein
MISSRKFQLLTVLVLLGCYFPALCEEPNEVKTELRFETSAEKQRYPVAIERQREIGIKPTYMGEVFAANMPPMSEPVRGPRRPRAKIHRSWDDPKSYIDFSSRETIRAILDTPSGKSVSEQEREFFTAGWGLLFRIKDFGDEIPNYTSVLLYAVSEEDAKKISLAFIEFLRNEADKEVEFWQNGKKKLVAKIPNLTKSLKECEEQLPAARKKLEHLTGIYHYLTTDEAKQTIVDLNKTLNTVRIELRTREARIEAIQAAIIDGRGVWGTKSTDIQQKLEEMHVYATIELTTAKAKKDIVERMISQAQEFIALLRQVDRLPKRNDELKHELRVAERGLQMVEDRLANPTPEMLPPKVFQDKVTIYPVHVEE